MSKQQGFSLIELAIVLVIAGLLLAGVLRGQEWIANAKVKSLASDFRHIPTYFYGYQDRFRALPGDDHVAETHVNGGTNATSTGQTQDGSIQGTWNSTTTTDESFLVWQHLRLAGLMNGSTDTAVPEKFVPRNSEGGQIGVTGLASLNGTVTATLTGAHAVCSEGILGRYATQLDAMLDDGAGNSGAMRVVEKGTASAGIASPDQTKPYIVCMSF